jgi:hypothetical protein
MAGFFLASPVFGEFNGLSLPINMDIVDSVKNFRKATLVSILAITAVGCDKHTKSDDAAEWFKRGNAYARGEGVRQDNSEAFKLFRMAAENGNADAQWTLGYSYDEGKGIPKDDAEAVKWYRKAAEQGHADAQFNLGYRYDEGKGVPKDDAEAVKWYRKAAEQGHADAQSNLSWAYEKGEGVRKDDTEAAKWCRKAAEQGKVASQKNLGYRFYRGDGVPKDLVMAYMWFNLAAGASDIGGVVTARDRLAEEMTREQIAEAQKLSREWKPKGNSNPHY